MVQKRNILIVDDNIINRQILCKILENDYNIVQAENGQNALEILKSVQNDFSAILLDLIMPIMDGYTFLKIQQHDSAILNIPVIVVTTQSDGDETEIKVLSLGASDFLIKPYKPAIIKHRLANIIKIRETSAFINSIEKDSLTGLYNKEFFYQNAREIIKANPGKKYDIICSDVERFKFINDIFGTYTGDKLLKYIAELIEECVGKYGICGRLHSDNFVVFISHFDYTNEMFKNAIRKISDFSANINVNITMKYGIYSIEDFNIPIDVMCDRAKLACNSIKGKYEICYAYYDDSIRQKILDEQAIATSMKTALCEGQFKVYFQPKYCLLTEKIVGAEALVRWRHPEKGFLSPAEFIPLFEKNGFIIELDIYVWDFVCNRIRYWLDKGHEVTSVSVNVSRVDIYNPNLTKNLIEIVNKYNIPSKLLHLEITETAYTENPKQIIEVVTRLKKLGFVIEMDDFGTGYSSLSMISEIPIDILKLDRSFIQNEIKKDNSKNILSFIISLAKWLDLLVVAEGVETKEQVQMLRNMDCNYAQGYYYAKPMPYEEFENLLFNSQIEDMNISKRKFELAKDIIVSKKNDKILNQTMLIVDNADINRRILSGMFKENYIIEEVNNSAVALEYIENHKSDIDVILLDLLMPIMDGFQLLLKLKKNKELSHIPVIITSQAGVDSKLKALEFGADDFISKPYNANIAIRRVENVMAYTKVKALERERELTLAIMKMRQRIERDSLTGLLNKSEFEMRIHRFFAENTNIQSTFIVFDIDNFKFVNDTFGYAFGDEVLCYVANILNEYFEDSDFISRIGGDEYAVFIHRSAFSENLKNNIELLLSKLNFCLNKINISCSIGICFAPDFGHDYKSLYNNADMALLCAKQCGKNVYKIFNNQIGLNAHVDFKEDANWLIDEISDGLFICDEENFDILYINNVACQIANKDKRNCLGKKCYEVMWNINQPCDRCVKLDYYKKDFYNNAEFFKDGYEIKGKLLEWNGRKMRVHYIQSNKNMIKENI